MRLVMSVVFVFYPVLVKRIRTTCIPPLLSLAHVIYHSILDSVIVDWSVLAQMYKHLTSLWIEIELKDLSL